MVSLEVVGQDPPGLVAEESGGDDGVVAGGEVETLVPVDSIGGQTGRILNINLSVIVYLDHHCEYHHLDTAVLECCSRGEETSTL